MANGFESEQLLAAIHARRELGEDYERALVESFVQQVDQEIEAQVDARVAQYVRGGSLGRQSVWPGGLAIVTSLIFAIPLSTIAGAFGHLAGILVAWGGIVLVNFVYAWRRPLRRKPRRPR